jgi:DNA-directed RNA polymerase II subunit RPB2
LGQERASENMVHCYNIEKNNTKWNWMAEIKSIPENKCISPKQISVMYSQKMNGNGFANSIYIQIPRLKNPIPIFVVFRALGIISDKEICEIILLDITTHASNKLLPILEGAVIESNDITTQEDAIKYIMGHVMYTPINMDFETGQAKKMEFANDVLNNDLFPHCNTRSEKIYFLGYMIKKLLDCSQGNIIQTDRDNTKNKRIDTTGMLLNNLFRNYLNKLVKEMQKQVVKEINNGSWKSTNNFKRIINQTNIYKLIKSSTIENGLKRALATGDFGIKHTPNSNKVGVGQVLSRLTYPATISHLRRINTPIDKSGKLIPPRKLHNSIFGFICPVETPEGQSVGVVKNIASLTHISNPSCSHSIYEYVGVYLIPITPDIIPQDLDKKVKVFVNGCWVGVTDTPMELYMDLKHKKCKGIINLYTSIVFNYQQKEILICNKMGRLVRPVLRVKNNKLILTKDIIARVRLGELQWEDLLVSGKIEKSVIEYLDPEEQNASMIAMQPGQMVDNDRKITYTHCEIHPSTIFGILASIVPFPEHNQAPRNTYQCAMGKQAIGVYVTNYNNRMDRTSYILTYPSKPLVDTRMMNIMKLNRVPAGFQVIVAIMVYSGYNQEDSVIINQSAVDRGMFQATIRHTEKDEDKKIHGDEELRCKPDPSNTRRLKFGNYDKINKDGVIPRNMLVENRDIIIAKMIPIKNARNDYTQLIKYEDHSRSYKTNEESYIDKNILDRNGDGYPFCKTRIRALRKPIIGDKFSSRCGQKGTIGNIIADKDMPFTKDGIKPDIIINPHAIPSRMTIAQLKETALGRLLVELGLYGDGTGFNDMPIEFIRKNLVKNGFEANSNDILYDGLTGQQLTSDIFIGPVYYQRLKHMVLDKEHSRSFGPMVNATRQPAEGRSREGGLRFGEMERDCMISHGAPRFTKERVYDVSDKYSVHVCKCCGMIACYNNEKNIHKCNTCHNRTEFDLIQIPYACKLLCQELITMNIAPRFITEK